MLLQVRAQLAFTGGGERRARDGVDARQLLRIAQAHPGHDALLDRGSARGLAHQRRAVDALRPQQRAQLLPGGIRAGDAGEDGLAAEARDGDGGVGRAARDEAAALEFQHRHRRLAAHARRAAAYIFIQQHIADDQNPAARQPRHPALQ